MLLFFSAPIRIFTVDAAQNLRRCIEFHVEDGEEVSLIEYGGNLIGDIKDIQGIESISTKVVRLPISQDDKPAAEVNSTENSNENVCTNAEELASYTGKLHPPPTDFDPSNKSLALRTWLAVECKKQVDLHHSKHSDRSICRIFNVSRPTFYRHFNDKDGPAKYNYYTIGHSSRRARSS